MSPLKGSNSTSGEFVGIVADNPDEKINLKMFHSEIQNDHEAIAREERGYKAIPVVNQVSAEDVQENYLRIKRDIGELFARELKKISDKKYKEEQSDLKDGNQEKKNSDDNTSNSPAISL